MFSKMRTKHTMKQNYYELPNGYLESIRYGIDSVRSFRSGLTQGSLTRKEALEKLIMEGSEKNPEYFTVYVLFETEDTLAVLNSDDNYMTVYDPPEHLRDLLQVLAEAEGLFMWQPQD